MMTTSNNAGGSFRDNQCGPNRSGFETLPIGYESAATVPTVGLRGQDQLTMIAVSLSMVL